MNFTFLVIFLLLTLAITYKTLKISNKQLTLIVLVLFIILVSYNVKEKFQVQTSSTTENQTSSSTGNQTSSSSSGNLTTSSSGNLTSSSTGNQTSSSTGNQTSSSTGNQTSSSISTELVEEDPRFFLMDSPESINNYLNLLNMDKRKPKLVNGNIYAEALDSHKKVY